MFRALKWLTLVDLILVLVSLFQNRPDWLMSTQIAFVSSTLVLGASMFSYRQMVGNRLASGKVLPDTQRDTLDKIEDPYALYEEEEILEDTTSLKETIREEKQRMKRHRRSFFQVIQDSRASLSFLRLGAYLLLFAGFFYLNRHHLLHIPGYLLGLTLPIVTILWLLLSRKDEDHEAGL